MTKSLVNKIIIIFLITTIISVLLITYFFIKNDSKVKEMLIKENILKLAEEKAQVINLIFKNIENETENLGYALKFLMEAQVKSEKLSAVETSYQRDSRGVLGRTDSTENSSVFLSRDVALTPEIKKEICITEILDPLLKSIKHNNPVVEWVYITSSNNLLRVYPYLSNDIFDADHKHYKDPFYTIANEENNPERRVVWSSPYYDYAGKGWVLTCSYPVYMDDRLVMVVSLDIALNSIKELIADFKLIKTGFAFLIDKDGNVIYHPHYIPAFGKEGRLLAQNLLTSSETEYKNIIEALFRSKKGIFEYKDKLGETYLISGAKINDNLLLGIQVNKKDYMLNFVNFFPAFTDIIVVMIITVIVLGTYLFYRISIPISKLVRETKKIENGHYGEVLSIASDDEIGELSKVFNKMSLTIKERTQKLEESKQQLEMVFNSINELFFICKPDYTVVLVNEKSKQIYENVDEAVEKGEKCYSIFRKRSAPCAGCPIRELLKTGRSIERNVAVDNKVYNVDATPILDNNNRIIQIIIYSRDITHSFITNRIAAHREKLAELGQITAGIFHELKNPISVMKGSIFLLNDILKTQSLQKRDIEDINFSVKELEKSVEYAEGIISNILEFTRKSAKDREDIPLSKIIDHILLMLNQKIVNQSILVYTSVNDDISVYMNIDSLRLILMNIILNSIQAMPHGGKLQIAAFKTEDKKWVEVKVTDTGCGIDKRNVYKIFNPYFTTKEKGTGLGLWIVKNEVESFGGKIKVDSKAGVCTTFTIFLPSS